MPLSINDFAQAAGAQIAAGDESGSLRVSDGQIDSLGRFRTAFTSSDQRVQTMNAFLDAVEREHGGAATNMAREAMVRAGWQEGRPLTARLVQAATEGLHVGLLQGAIANRSVPASADLSRLLAAPEAEQPAALLRCLKDVIVNHGSAAVEVMTHARERLSLEDRGRLDRLLQTPAMLEAGDLLDQSLEILQSARGENAAAQADSQPRPNAAAAPNSLQARFNEMVADRRERRTTLIGLRQGLQALGGDAQPPAASNAGRRAVSWSSASPAAIGAVAQATGSPRDWLPPMARIATQMERSASFFRGNGVGVSDIRAQTTTTMTRSDLAGHFNNLLPPADVLPADRMRDAFNEAAAILSGSREPDNASPEGRAAAEMTRGYLGLLADDPEISAFMRDSLAPTLRGVREGAQEALNNAGSRPNSLGAELARGIQERSGDGSQILRNAVHSVAFLTSFASVTSSSLAQNDPRLMGAATFMLATISVLLRSAGGMTAGVRALVNRAVPGFDALTAPLAPPPSPTPPPA